MKKKGVWLLGPVVLKILIAIISIVILIYLLNSLIGIFTQKTSIEQARASVDNLVQTINDMSEGDGSEFILFGATDWYLIGWKSDSERLPAECEGKGCLCMCSKGNADSCESEGGICTALDNAEPEVFSYVFGVAPRPNMNLNFCFLYEGSCIYMSQGEKVPLEEIPLTIKKENSVVKIIPKKNVRVNEDGSYNPVQGGVRKVPGFSCYDVRRTEGSGTYGC